MQIKAQRRQWGTPNPCCPTGQGGEICPPVAKLPPGVKARGPGRIPQCEKGQGWSDPVDTQCRHLWSPGRGSAPGQVTWLSSRGDPSTAVPKSSEVSRTLIQSFEWPAKVPHTPEQGPVLLCPAPALRQSRAAHGGAAQLFLSGDQYPCRRHFSRGVRTVDDRHPSACQGAEQGSTWAHSCSRTYHSLCWCRSDSRRGWNDL